MIVILFVLNFGLLTTCTFLEDLDDILLFIPIFPVLR